MQKLTLAFLALLLLALPLEAATRVALVTNEPSPETDQILFLAESQLGNDPQLELFDRKNVLKVLTEQKLALSGLVDPEQAIRAGKFLNVDLFAIVEGEPEGEPSDKKKKHLLGLSALDSRSGVRLWDASLAGGGLEETAAQIAAGVREAAAKYQARGKDARTVGILTVRNADLPRSLDPTIQTIGRLLERNLVRAPGLAVVERERLRAILQERNLPTREAPSPLLASLSLLELEIGRGPDRGFAAHVRVTDGAGKEIATLKGAAAAPAALVDALLPQVLAALNVKKAGGALDHAQEADRYYAESWIWWRHREYERAAFAAEAVHALDPDSNPRLKWLFDRLSEAAVELIDPGQQQGGGPAKKPIDPVALEQSIELARHALNLHGLYLARAQRKADWYRDQNGLSLMFFNVYLSKIVAFDEKTTPRSRELVAELIDEYRDMQFNVYGRGLYETAKAGKGFREYTSWVASQALLDIFHRFSKVRDDWPQDAADVLTRWADLADAQHPSQDRQLMRSCDYVLMTVQFSERVPQLDEKNAQPLRDAYAFLESRTDPLLQLHGRLLSLHLEVRELKKLTPEEARRPVADLVEKIEPHAIAPDGPTQDTQTRRRWIDMILRANALLTGEDRWPANRKFYDLLESHGIYSQQALFEASLLYRLQNNAPEEDKKANQQKLLDLLSGAIVLLEKKPVGITADELRGELRKLREEHRTLAEKLGISGNVATPWESVHTLVDVAAAEKGIRSLVRPVVVGRQVYSLGMDWDFDAGQVSFSLLSYDLDSHAARQIATWAIDQLPKGEFGKTRGFENGEITVLGAIQRSTTEGSYFIRSACVADDNYYAATLGRGIVVFPLQGGVPKRLDESTGLPSDFVQYVMAHNGFLYAWLGQPRKTAYLVRLKTDGSDVQVIASSRRTFKKTPLDNVAPVLCDFMMLDKPRDRIVFRLTSNGSDAVLGFWELTLEKHEVRQLKQTHMILSGDPPRDVADGQILVKHGFVANLFDLKTGSLRPLVRYETDMTGNFCPIAFVDGKVWIGYPFSSIDVKTRKIDIFPNLRPPERRRPGEPQLPFQPGVVFEKVGDRECLLGDPGALWLIKLKPAAPPAGEAEVKVP
jgi:hypothetical protein